MRVRTELAFASVVLVLLGSLTHYISQADGGEPGPNWKCGGNTVNCMGDRCLVNPQSEDGQVWSCGTVGPIDHPKCVAGTSTDCCETKQVPCAEIKFNGGQPCTGSPAACQNIPVGTPRTLREDGCDPNTNCSSPADPPGGGVD